MPDVHIQTYIDLVQDQGCRLLDEFTLEDGERWVWLMSRNNTRRVRLCATDETMTLTTANENLVQLELEDVIGRLPTV